MSNQKTSPLILFTYRYRFPLAALMVISVFGFFGAGIAKVKSFSAQVDSLKDHPPEVPPDPRMFDARYDIWFDPADEGLRTYKDVEDVFVAEDAVIVAFEDTKDPWGVFGVDALSAIARLTANIESVPYVRSVRSLTGNPWIRWGQAGPDAVWCHVPRPTLQWAANAVRGHEHDLRIPGGERRVGLDGHAHQVG